MNNIIKRTVPLWLTLATIIVLGGAVLWLYGRVSTLESRLSSIEDGSLSQLSITISSLDDEQGRHGQYFRFDTAQLDQHFGKDGWSGKQFIAVAPNRGFVEPIRLWVRESDGRVGLGRTENDLPNLNWTVGENLIILF